VIQPTIGRVVWYHPSSFDNISAPEEGHCAAIITAVWDPSRVNLVVFDLEGRSHPRASVFLSQDGIPPVHSESWCEWMPYQKGQAAKTEALEQKLLNQASAGAA
jgi:hypothetical protein